MTTLREARRRQRLRDERSQRAVAAAAALAREHGLRVEEPTVLADPFRFLQAPTGNMRPLHGDAHAGNLIATRDGLVWIAIEWDLATMMDADAAAAHHQPDPEVLARCMMHGPRALQAAFA